MNSEKKIMGAGLLTALAASLCCIAPLLAILAGTSGIAATFSWLEPFRPYLMGITLLLLGLAWYQKCKTKKKPDCDCEVEKAPKFLQSKLFLAIVTALALLLIAFPYYAQCFYKNPEKQPKVVVQSNKQTVEFTISGMTCSACEVHVDREVKKLPGIINLTTSFEKGNTIVELDSSTVSIPEVEKAINSTGYTVTGKKKK